MPLEVDLSDGLAALCLRAALPVHRCWHELSESGCCEEEFGSGMDRVSWLAFEHYIVILTSIHGSFLK